METSAPEPRVSRRRIRVAWTLGIGGMLLFVLSITGTLSTGARIGNAVELLNGRHTLATQAFERAHRQLCEGESAPTGACAADGAPDIAALRSCLAGSTLDESPACRSLWVTALEALDESSVGPSTSGDAEPPSRPLGLQALGVSAAAVGLLDYSGRSLADNVSVSLTPLFASAIIGLALMFIGLGIGHTGRWSGVVISPQNRVSLALMQMICWTIVLVAAYAVLAAFNVGLIAETAVREGAGNGSYFPSMPGWTWAVLGLTAGTPFVSSLIKGWKPSDGVVSSEVDVGPVSRIGVALAPLDRNVSPFDASVADLFFGEDVNNRTRLDITRTQNVLFTVVLLLAYVGFLIGMMNDLSPAQLAASIAAPSALFAAFPDPGATFAGLLAATHAAYLAGKYQPGDASVGGDVASSEAEAQGDRERTAR